MTLKRALYQVLFLGNHLNMQDMRWQSIYMYQYTVKQAGNGIKKSSTRKSLIYDQILTANITCKRSEWLSFRKVCFLRQLSFSRAKKQLVDFRVQIVPRFVCLQEKTERKQDSRSVDNFLKFSPC